MPLFSITTSSKKVMDVTDSIICLLSIARIGNQYSSLQTRARRKRISDWQKYTYKFHLICLNTLDFYWSDFDC